jgi:GNAT superfamily N-acetyltransferase
VIYTLLPATEDDAHELAPLLRAADRAEVLALGAEPIDGLLDSLRASREAWTARADGQIICMTGVCPLTLIGSTGVPWLLGSDLVPKHGPHFLRESRRLVARWREMFPVLENRVPADYAAALRWARWMGFTVHPGQPFCKITMGGGLEVRKSSFREIEADPNFPNLLDGYAAESAIAGLPPPKCKSEAYHRLEDLGLLHVLAARRDGLLIGFIFVVAAVLPHYSTLIAVSESFFVDKDHRKTGAGLRLLRQAEAKAREVGSPVLLVSAPFEGDLFRVLPHVGYTEANRVFVKRVQHDA